ncbi:translation initiation factor IF-2-like isoform X2 [Nilaparvata lugens]|nr:translation initiation factor IF-2-like isoform X2 [Nilaparvata lugens]
MLGVMGSHTHTPMAMDFSLSSDHTVLDLRKTKSKNEHQYITHQPDIHEAASPTSYQPISPIACYPTTTYYHNMESSEDSSDRGSLSPPSSTSYSTTTPFGAGIVTPTLISPVVNRSGNQRAPSRPTPRTPSPCPHSPPPKRSSATRPTRPTPSSDGVCSLSYRASPAIPTTPR